MYPCLPWAPSWRQDGRCQQNRVCSAQQDSRGPQGLADSCCGSGRPSWRGPGGLRWAPGQAGPQPAAGQGGRHVVPATAEVSGSCLGPGKAWVWGVPSGSRARARARCGRAMSRAQVGCGRGAVWRLREPPFHSPCPRPGLCVPRGLLPTCVNKHTCVSAQVLPHPQWCAPPLPTGGWLRPGSPREGQGSRGAVSSHRHHCGQACPSWPRAWGEVGLPRA